MSNNQDNGNSAAMREAIENSNELLEELAAIGEWSESAREQIAENNTALSAPPRNCDQYNTSEESIRMFESYIRESGKVGFINPFTEVVKWLFAPATEQKGEDE